MLPRLSFQESEICDNNLSPKTPLVCDDETTGFSVNNIDNFYTPKTVIGTDLPSVTLEEIQKFDPKCRNIKEVLILYTGGTIGMRVKNGAYEPEPNYLTKALKRLPMFNDHRIRKEMPILNEVFVMPRSPDDIRVIFNLWEYSPLLDSSDMTMDDYVRISKDIANEYNNYDGFIILHGTDTMSFTGSALSFLCENLTKPIILTGSQIPLFELRSDGRENLLASLIIASHYNIPEVTIFFHEKLYRANRTTKMSSTEFNAFDSPNYPPLVECGINIKIYEHRLFKNHQKNNLIKVEKPFTVSSSLDNNVTVLRMFPSITWTTVKALLAPPVLGVVLQSYGSGNMPFCRKDLLECFKEAYDRGCIIINISQCFNGGVKPIYRTGFILKEYGILPGIDMTVESSLTKLSYVLARSDWSIETKRSAMTRNLRGEMTVAHYDARKDMRSLSQDEILIDHECIIAAALCNSAKEGNVANMEQLGRRRGNWEAADYDGRTALHIASSENQLEAVLFLLDMKVRMNRTDRQGYTPLRCAVLYGSDKKLIKTLTQHGGVLAMSPREIRQEIVIAIQNNNLTLLQSYIYAGVDIHSIDENGNTYLHEAVMSGRSEVVKKLLELGCSHTVTNKHGNTAYDEANIREYENILKIFEEFQAPQTNSTPS